MKAIKNIRRRVKNLAANIGRGAEFVPTTDERAMDTMFHMGFQTVLTADMMADLYAKDTEEPYWQR